MNTVSTPSDLAAQGKAAFERSLYRDASDLFLAAGQGYAAAGDSLNAAEMANNRSVALLKAGDAGAALESVHGTEATFAQAGDQRRQAMAAGNQAAALQELGEVKAAIEAYERSADLFKEAGEHEMRTYVLRSLSTLQMLEGQQYVAMSSLQASYEEIEKPNLFQRLLRKILSIPAKFFFRS